MNEVMKMTKKVVSTAVVASTIAWSVSVAAFLAPLSAKAAVSGSLVKASLPAVYYVGQDGKRYVFPNEKTFKTWYVNFSSVVTISDAELASMMIGGNVTYKPGVKMVKITTDPKVYAVDANGKLRPIASEAVAAALYGTNWNQHIEDVPDAFFTNYSIGAAVNSASDFNPAAASAAAVSINVDKGLSSSPTPPTTPGSQEGSLEIDRASTPSAATLIPGDINEEVAGFDLEAQDSDISVTRVDVEFEIDNNMTEDRPWRYFSSVALYDGSTLLASKNITGDGDFLSSDDGDSDGEDEYVLRFSGMNMLVQDDTTKKLSVRVTANSVIDSGNSGAIWAVDIVDARYEDEAGFSETTENIGSVRTFTVTTSDASLKVTLNPSSPKDQLSMVDDEGTTENITVLVVNLKAEKQAVTVTDLEVYLDTTGLSEASALATDVFLYDGSTLLASESVGDNADETVVFDDLSLNIAKDQTKALTVKITANEQNGGDFDAGESVVATLTVTKAEDHNGDQVSFNPDTQTGEAVTFYVVVPQFTLGAVSNVKTDGEITASITFSLKAVGGDLYLSRDLADHIASNVGSGAAFNSTDMTDLTSVSGTDGTNGYRVDEDQTRTFQIVAVSPDGDPAGGYILQIDELCWADNDSTFDGGCDDGSEQSTTLTNWKTGLQVR